MFSGKTTSLIKCAKKFMENNKQVLIINSSLDVRCGDSIQTHDKLQIPAIKTDLLKNSLIPDDSN